MIGINDLKLDKHQMTLLRELCYIVDSFNHFTKQSKDISITYQFFQHVKGVGYNPNTLQQANPADLDRLMREANESLEKLGAAKSEFVRANGDRVTAISKALDPYNIKVVKKPALLDDKLLIQRYEILYKRTLISDKDISDMAATHSLEQIFGRG